MKSSQGSALTTADFDAITGWDHDEDNTDNVTYYSDAITTWNISTQTGNLNTIYLNQNAVDDVIANDYLQVNIIN